MLMTHTHTYRANSLKTKKPITANTQLSLPSNLIHISILREDHPTDQVTPTAR